MVASQCTHTTEQMVTREISALVTYSLQIIMQCAYEKACARARYFVNDVVEKVPYNLLHRKVIDETLDKHITNCSNISDAADKICEKLLCTKDFMEPSGVFIQSRAGEAFAKECLNTKLGNSYRCR